MITSTFRRNFISSILFAIIFIASRTVAIGQNFNIDFATSAPNQVINTPTGINISEVEISTGTISYGSFGTTFGGTPHAGSNSDWMATNNPLLAKNFFFTITADPGYTFDLTAVSSLVRSTNAGASDMALIVDGDLIESVATPNSGTPVLSVSGSGLTAYTGLTSITVRIVGYDGGSRTSTGGGASRIGAIEGTLVVNAPAVGPPIDVTTGTAGSITETGAVISNNSVGADGGSAITARGVVYGISPEPTLADNVETITGTTGSFDATLSSLTANTTYYVRAYATNA